jgi:colicin import membrane protein
MSTDALKNQFIEIPRAALVASVILHLMIPVSFVTVKGLEMLGIQIFPPTHVKDVYQEFVQVDIVGLPDVSIPDLEKLDPALPEVETPAKEIDPPKEVEDDTMALESAKKAIAEKEKADKEEKAKKAKKEEEEKKKALKQVEEELKRDQALKALAQNEGNKGRTKLKGNILSKGTAVMGNIGTPKDQYTAIVMAKIKEKIYIMPNQRDRGLNNAVHIELYPTGRVRAKQLVRGSGDGIYDRAMMQAIEDAQPLPIPEDLSLIQGGITVTFRAEEK